MAADQLSVGKILLKCLIVLIVPDFIYSYTYPVFGTKRYGRSGPVHHSAYIPVPIPVARRYTEYQVPEYDEGYLAPSQPEEYEYNAYDKYPFVPYYNYYPRDYYHEKSDRRNADNYGYFEEEAPNDPIDDLQEEMMQDDRGKDDAYGQETWFEGGNPRYENNAEANAAFLQNLIIAQMYQDAAASAAVNAGNPSRYAAAFPFVYTPVAPNEDYDDRNWLYGVPTTGIDEKEKAQQYFKNGEDEEVKELESLRKKNKQKQNKQKDGSKKKNKNKNQKNKIEQTDISNDEFLAELKNRRNRKNYVDERGDLIINKKNIVNPTDVKYDSWNLGKVSLKSYPDSPKEGLGKLVTSKPLKMNGFNFSDRKNRIEVPTTIAATTTTTTTTSTPSTTTTERPISFGQKEVVLPRPANPVRRPYSERMSLRSTHQPSVYDTIKQLLSMEEDVRQGGISRPQKRFVLSEDQLTAELNGLKKLAA